MGKKTSFTLQLLGAGLVTGLVTVALVTDEFVMTQPSDPNAETTQAVSVDSIQDGTYQGVAQGYGGPVTVEVEVVNGEIASVTPIDHGESAGISDPAFEQVPDAIVASNSTQVDVASGATLSSNAIMGAVNNALGSSDGGEAAGGTETASTGMTYREDPITGAFQREVEDGVYYGVADGAHGPIEVEVTVASGAITAVEILSQEETPGITDNAFIDVPNAIVEYNQVAVDVASGATYASLGVMGAVGDALVNATVTDAYEPAEPNFEAVNVANVESGTYQGTAEGHNGPVEVEVVVEDGQITSVDILDHQESDGISDAAIEQVPVSIVENNTSKVDNVSGATASSTAIMTAVNNALSEAETVEGAVVEEDAETEETADAAYTDGTYEGTAEGYISDITVEVVVAEGVISEVNVVESEETEGIADPALEEVPQAIVDANSTQVDVVSGATGTSEGIMAAAEEALAQAGEETAEAEEETAEADEEPIIYADGTYEVTTEGYVDDIVVEVVIEGGALAEVNIVESNETEDIAGDALEQIPAAMVEENSTVVDTVSGATATSNAIITAVEEALEEAAEKEESGEAEAAAYEDGTYEATVPAHNNDITVEVVVKDGVIAEVNILESQETQGIADPALENIPEAIVEENSTDVDTITGATVTSEAIMEAVEKALADA